ncbi:MAG: hypothetical protein AAGA60_25510 [Cyanobacteria bacterium P01_E01_bin.42]
MKITQIFSLACIFFASAVNFPARAGGSLMLSDIAPLVAQSSQLEAEIEKMLTETDRTIAEIVCIGGRVSGRYGGLGGARFAPFRCLFGEELLIIEADNLVSLPDDSSFSLEELPHRETFPEGMTLSFQLRSWSWGKVE